MNEKAILFDATRCIACRGCQVACKAWNELEAAETTSRGTYENPPDLSPTTWLTISFTEKTEGDSIKWLFGRRSCMHCTEAACVEVCPSGALYHNEYGFIGYDKDKCIGCGYCTELCPFNIPRLDADRVTGIGKIGKCTLCTTPGLDRLLTGEEPACVKTCPTGALLFGNRDDIVAEGKNRVTVLKASDHGAYSQTMLYGESELGGLHVLYVLADSPEVYGLPEKPQFPVMATIRNDVFRPFSWMVWVAVAAGLALNVLVVRARRIHKKEVI